MNELINQIPEWSTLEDMTKVFWIVLGLNTLIVIYYYADKIYGEEYEVDEDSDYDIDYDIDYDSGYIEYWKRQQEEAKNKTKNKETSKNNN